MCCPRLPLRRSLVGLVAWSLREGSCPWPAPAWQMVRTSLWQRAGAPACSRFGQYRQHDARTLRDARRGCTVGYQALEVIARLGGPASLVRSHTHKLAGAEPPRILLGRKRREPILQVRKARAVQFQHGNLQTGVVGQDRIDAAVLGDLLVGSRRLGDIACTLVVIRPGADGSAWRNRTERSRPGPRAPFAPRPGLFRAKSRRPMI